VTNTIILVCGVQATGKSWLCRQLTGHYHYIAHDRCWVHPNATPETGDDPHWVPGATSTHLQTLVNKAWDSELPILTEVPFAERKLKNDLIDHGLKVIQVFVVDEPETILTRYFEREGKELPGGVLIRNNSMREKAIAQGDFFGNSNEVLEHLKELSHATFQPTPKQSNLPASHRFIHSSDDSVPD